MESNRSKYKMTKVITIRVNDSDYKQIEYLRHKNNTSISELLRQYINFLYFDSLKLKANKMVHTNKSTNESNNKGNNDNTNNNGELLDFE